MQSKESQRQISTGNSLHDCKLVERKQVNNEIQKGTLDSYEVEGYGITQPFFVPEGQVLGSQAESRRDRSGMPGKYVYKTAQDFKWDCYGEDTKFQKDIANKFISQFETFKKEGRGLYIYSETKGSGKTMLACCLANELLRKRDISIKFITSVDYLELIKDRADTAREQVQTLYNAGIVIFDDIGAEGRKDWIESSLFRFVNSRNVNMLPTIYTSNCGIEELSCDDRIKDRILETSIPVIMPEKSIRSEKARASTKAFIQKLNEKPE